MGKKWLVPALLAAVVGAAGLGLTGDKTQQEVQKMSVRAARAENIGCMAAESNPLREDADQELLGAVKDYYAGLKRDSDFAEAYDDIHVYTKRGKYKDTYIAFATYEMKIRDIYTEVPGLQTLFVEKDGTDGYDVRADAGDEEERDYISRMCSHGDVEALFARTDEEYAAALDSDALLSEALTDLQNAL